GQVAFLGRHHFQRTAAGFGPAVAAMLAARLAAVPAVATVLILARGFARPVLALAALRLPAALIRVLFALALLVVRLPACLLRAHDAEIMLRVLQVVLRLHAVSGRGGVAGQLLVFFVNRDRRAPDLH